MFAARNMFMTTGPTRVQYLSNFAAAGAQFPGTDWNATYTPPGQGEMLVGVITQSPSRDQWLSGNNFSNGSSSGIYWSGTGTTDAYVTAIFNRPTTSSYQKLNAVLYGAPGPLAGTPPMAISDHSVAALEGATNLALVRSNIDGTQAVIGGAGTYTSGGNSSVGIFVGYWSGGQLTILKFAPLSGSQLSSAMSYGVVMYAGVGGDPYHYQGWVGNASNPSIDFTDPGNWSNPGTTSIGFNTLDNSQKYWGFLSATAESQVLGPAPAWWVACGDSDQSSASAPAPSGVVVMP